MKQQLMMLLLGTASVFCSCETQNSTRRMNYVLRHIRW